MRNNATDNTLKKNYVQKYQYLIKEYEQVKEKKHLQYTKVKDFYKAHGTCPQTFLKYYARYKQSGESIEALLPGKRGPKYFTRRPDQEITDAVLQLRARGCNRYEIYSMLKGRFKDKTPSPSGVYNILKRYKKNRLTPKMVEEKRRIIKEMAGELCHIDCHHLSKDMISNDNKRRYLVCVIDSCTRIAWAEVVDDIKSLTVMFTTLRCFNYITQEYNIKFAEALADNGPEFGPRDSKNKDNHPFERMLSELGIKRRYIKPYRPQTNGKVERFWRTLNDDLIDGTYFESIDHFKDELLKYIVYYNQFRPHQGLAGKIPADFAKNCKRIS